MNKEPKLNVRSITGRYINETSEPIPVALESVIHYKMFTSDKSIIDAFDLARTWMNLNNIKAEAMESEIKINVISYANSDIKNVTKTKNTVTVHYYETN